MPFSISSWLLRKRIDVHVRQSGRPMEHLRVVNPYHAVSIKPGSKCCEDARKLEGHRFLATGAPTVPLKGCTSASCQCRYIHYNDRRNAEDRRKEPRNPYAHKMTERRATGRRITDY